MNIAYIIPSLKRMGPINVVYDLVQVMQKHDHHCDVYYFDDFGIANYFPCDAIKIDMKNLIEFNRYDIIHTHGLRPNIYVFHHKPFKHNRTKFISTFHNYVFDDFVMKYGKIKGYLGGAAFLLTALRHDKIVALSKDAQRYYQRWYGKRKVSFIYNTRIIDPEVSLSDDEKNVLLSFKGNSTLIGMNGSIIYLKGIDMMLRALLHLPERFKLFLVGDGKDMEKMKNLAEGMKLMNRVYFAGRKQHAYKYLPYYDIYALPSRSEGFPLALLEAACMGSTIVCSNLPILQETFSNDEVVMFQLPDEQALASSILKAENNHTMGKNVQAKFLAHYSPAHFYQEHIKLYSNPL